MVPPLFFFRARRPSLPRLSSCADGCLKISGRLFFIYSCSFVASVAPVSHRLSRTRSSLVIGGGAL